MLKRKWLLVGLATTTAFGVALFALLSLPGQARTNQGADDTASVRPVQLPVGQVVLFSSGVGYFQREGSVEGDARVDLSFPASDINDLIKSMVLRDLNGGHISAVSYDSNSPVERTLKSFAINLTGNPGFAQIIDQARGEKVEVSLLQANNGQPATLTGTIIGVEKKAVPAGKDGSVEIDILSLWCSDGLRSLHLNEVARLRFLNPVLESEFRKALETLAQSHDTAKKAVSIHFAGQGKRDVRVGYVVENPLWKTSYRLVLDKKDKPYLQGWAVVENSTDEDWKDVRMALVSGRPISFQMDLYTPLFVPRPMVELELYASLRPPTYSRDLTPVKKSIQDSNKHQESAGKKMNGVRGGQDQDEAIKNLELAKKVRETDQPPNLGASVNTAATAAKLGDFFQYATDRIEKQLKLIVEDQSRLRANLKEMPSTAAAYTRYLKKFDEQEPVIEKHQADINRLQGKQAAQQVKFEEFLVNFSAE